MTSDATNGHDENLWWELLAQQASIRHDVVIELQGPIYGGMSGDRETLAKMPWKERNEQLQARAQKLTEASVPEMPPEPTVFRRTPEGFLALSPNQIRAFLQEVRDNIYGADPNTFKLRKALRHNMAVMPDLLPILRLVGRVGVPILEPTGFDYLPREINKPPFQRSVELQPEYVKGPVQVRFSLYIDEEGSGATLAVEVLRTLFDRGLVFIGMGAHRGIIEAQGAKGRVVSWETTRLREIELPRIPDSGRKRKAKAAAELAVDSTHVFTSDTQRH